MATIKIEIDCGEKECGKCRSVACTTVYGFRCRVFGYADLACDGHKPLRCPQCLDAEEK